MKNYVDYITDVTCKLLEIDSPTGYTRNAAEFVMEEYKKLPEFWNLINEFRPKKR